MPPNADCKHRFEDGIKAGDPAITQYQYNGTVRGIYIGISEPPPFISYDGCKKLCGPGASWYDWKDVSATISTWVLPVVGLLLQAPFESNAFLKTVFAMAHWLGSPISSLAAVLWNIKVFGRCSMIVDMATPCNSSIPGPDSTFDQIRDSFYLLSVMNQYSVKQSMPRVEAERLIRIVLFSDSLQLETVEDDTRNLVKRRKKLAKAIREGRKRGVVPVFISLLWFLFSLVTSVQQAFGRMGDNATAHNLALGLLLAWLPTFILCCIVDRNPTQPEAVRVKLNKLVHAVRKALLNPELRETYIKDIGRPRRSFTWTKMLDDEEFFREDFFTRFAGQGRVRWHYGIAHGILDGIEDSYVAKQGRDWLRDSEAARTALVRGPSDMQGLERDFNPEELWQIVGAFLIVGMSIAGAFVISYWTPTIGLGCRSGGYMIFFIMAFSALLIELLCWQYLSPGSVWDDSPVTRIKETSRRLSRAGLQHGRFGLNIKELSTWWRDLWKRDMVELLILRPLECVNTVWLAYIVMAQTTGSYTTCECQCSIWGLGAGYMDFKKTEYYLQIGIGLTWGFGAAIACVPTAIAFVYIVLEWCMQSHLSTVDYDSARKGLITTRKFRKVVQPIQDLYHTINNFGIALWRRLAGKRMFKPRHSNLTWSSVPKLKISSVPRGKGSNEPTIDERLLSPREVQFGDPFITTHLVSPQRSINRSPRSSFGQATGEEIITMKSFMSEV